MDALYDPVLSAGLCGEGAAGRTYDVATQSFGTVGHEAAQENWRSPFTRTAATTTTTMVARGGRCGT